MSNELKLYFRIMVPNTNILNYNQFMLLGKTNFKSTDNTSARAINMFMCDENGNLNDNIISFFINDIGQTNYQNIPNLNHTTYTTVMIRTNYSQKDSLNYNFFCACGFYNGLFPDQNIYKFTAYKTTSNGQFEGFNSAKISINFAENLGTVVLNKSSYIIDPIPFITNNKIKLYYRRSLFNLDGSKISMSVDFDYLYDVSNDLQARNNYYSGISSLQMTNEKYEPNDDIIYFYGSETRETSWQNVPHIYDVYNESVVIRKNFSNYEDDYSIIIGESMYNNGGTGSSTTMLDIVTYYVTTSSGIFYGFKKITIFFDNINQVRQIEITK